MKANIETVKSDRFEMNYFRFGTKGGKPMVILPGLSVKSVMESAFIIERSFKIFSGYDVYVIDRRTNLPPVYTVSDMATDTAEAMDILGIKNACLYCTSQGGMIGQLLAIRRPDLVYKMMLGSSASRLSESSEKAVSGWIGLAENAPAEKLMAAFAEQIYTDGFLAAYGDAFTAMAQFVTKDDLARFVIIAKGTAGFDVYDELDKIKCPVLVLGADKDRIFGAETFKETAEKLGCELYIYENYAHAVYDEAPDFRERVFRFFED